MTETRKLWEKYVKNQHLYRIVPERYVVQIKKEGLTPDKNPYTKQQKEIIAFFNILLKLHKQGFIMMRWWGKPVDQKQVVKTTLQDLNSNFIDFTPASKIEYYCNLSGGALPQTIQIYCIELLTKIPPLSEKEWELIRKLQKWSRKLCMDKNKVIAIKASSPYLEHARFQHFTGPDVESPFGSYEHFAKAIAKNGWKFYEPYLTSKKLFYVRTTKHIPSKELKW